MDASTKVGSYLFYHRCADVSGLFQRCISPHREIERSNRFQPPLPRSVGEEVEDIAQRAAVGLIDLGVPALGADDRGEALVLHVEQFQDITSQRVRATHALLGELDQRLTSLTDDLDKPEPVEAVKVVAGSFDSKGVYDREQAQKKQREIDDLIERLGSSPKEESKTPKKRAGAKARSPVKKNGPE